VLPRGARRAWRKGSFVRVWGTFSGFVRVWGGAAQACSLACYVLYVELPNVKSESQR
jgi:hypothetical protein